MQRFPFFTIITASLNNKASIKKTIESVKNQSFQRLEHIIIDGGSTDGTLNIIRQYENTYNLSWISEPDQGIADALNKALKISRGRYVLVIHADDQLLTKNVLERVYPILRGEKADIYSFPIFLDHKQKGGILKKPIRMLWWNHFKLIFLHQGCFVHKRLFKKIGDFDCSYKIAMDYDLFYRALLHGAKVKFLDFPIAIMGGKGISTIEDSIPNRLSEERRVQLSNEINMIWRILQIAFRSLYEPYKLFLAQNRFQLYLTILVIAKL